MEPTKTDIKEVNDHIKASGIDISQISDGYHTFEELYEHRIVLYIALCRRLDADQEFTFYIWRSKLHSDGTAYDGWFVLGIETNPGQQITYHLPMKYWDSCDFADELIQAPPFDGHTSKDVLKRISEL